MKKLKLFNMNFIVSLSQLVLSGHAVRKLCIILQSDFTTLDTGASDFGPQPVLGRTTSSASWFDFVGSDFRSSR